MRLINADDICNCLDRIDDEKNKLWYNFLRNVVQGVPAEDAELVRHGHWRITENGFFRCSQCNYFTTKAGTQNGDYFSFWDYCPNCGAKMDGGKNDN